MTSPRFFTIAVAMVSLGILLGAPSKAYAQSPEDLSGIKVEPTSSKNTDYEVDLGPQPRPEDDGVVRLPSEWARFAGGVWAGIVGQGVFGTFPRISTDKSFVGASERGTGIGLQMDMGVKHSRSQALRLRVGYLSLGLSPDAATLEKISSAELDARLKLVHLSLGYRWAWLSYGPRGIVWVGAAVSANYVTDTEPKDPAVASQSKLQNTFGVGYAALAGWDYPIYKYTDAGLELGFHPFRSFSIGLSLRTSL